MTHEPNTIVDLEDLAPGVTLFEVSAPRIAAAHLPGQFVMVRPRADDELIPLAVAWTDPAAGTLSPEGAALLDPTGALRPGIPLCPPEGDAGTGMVATNAVATRANLIELDARQLKGFAQPIPVFTVYGP